jgi:glyceraldehyde 3-phosphate dehydrogenase
VDLVAQLSKPATVDEINKAMKEASETYLKGILAYSEAPLVSIDFNGTTVSSTFDAPLTMVVGNMAKVLSWYDNEFGYATRMIELTAYMGGMK